VLVGADTDELVLEVESTLLTALTGVAIVLAGFEGISSIEVEWVTGTAAVEAGPTGMGWGTAKSVCLTTLTGDALGLGGLEEMASGAIEWVTGVAAVNADPTGSGRGAVSSSEAAVLARSPPVAVSVCCFARWAEVTIHSIPRGSDFAGTALFTVVEPDEASTLPVPLTASGSAAGALVNG
jgi:hypothetical protein